MTELNELLEHLIEQRGSDLHVKAGSVPHVRVHGRLQRTAYDPTTSTELEAIVAELLPVSRSQELADNGEISIAYGVSGLGRFRVNVYRQRGTYGLSVRWVVPGAPAIGALHLPPVVEKLAMEQSGLVLVTGPASSGRTTTIAALLDHINATRAAHIVTLEDPIEVLLSDKSSMVSQRELGVDTRSVADALRRVNRLDPDVLFVSDLTDAESIREVLSAAATGKLVLATLSTASAAATVQHLVGFFPVEQQAQVRHALASTLRGIVAQRMLDRTDGEGQVPAAEVLTSNRAVFGAIVDGASEPALVRLMSEGAEEGMQTFDQSLLRLVRDGVVSARDALGAARSPRDLQAALQPSGHG